MAASTPLFTVGEGIATFLVSSGILSKAWKESHLASNTESFSLNEYEGIAYVAFPSFHNIEGFVKGKKYGEGNIQTDNKVFSDRLKGNDDIPALVHQGALKLFLQIMKNTDFQAKLQIYTDSKRKELRPIIFVGHSLGGAVATLATLWVLEKRLRKRSPFCITFGCPLVGDVRLVEAVGREDWTGSFCHLISKHDIVPRMLLAPFESIVKPLTAILPYWQGILPYSFIQDDCKTLRENVLKYTSTVANYGRDPLRVLDGINDQRSPYRPFGTYMFCSSHGADCIENSETVLKMLHWTMQSVEKSSDNIVPACILEHTDYGSVLEEVIQNSIIERRMANSHISENSYEMGISLQLEAMGVRPENDHAKLALLRAGETENKFNTNVDKLAFELSLKQSAMAELEWYKEGCEKNGGVGYYDVFKNFTDIKAVGRADFCRMTLGMFWDDIIEKWKNHELPSDFESQNKWINAGNTYRLFVEPLDIAYYYRTNANGNYLSDGRPNRYKVLQKWMEDKEKTRSSRVKKPRTKRASLTQDSCFWAHVEEAKKDLEKLKQGQHQRLHNLEEFEKYVIGMENSLNISSDVFLEGSSFMMWWEDWKEYRQNHFPEWSSTLSVQIDRADLDPDGPREIESEYVDKLHIELISKKCIMAEIEWYKEACEKRDHITYYDSFKRQESKSDIRVSTRILTLARFWDDIIEMWESHELPSAFHSQIKWINAGTTYRRLVEPLDIARYYRTNVNGNGNYLSDGRPNRHKVLQKWMEEKENTSSSRRQKARTKPASLTQDSCFWAHVEEALKDLEFLKQGRHQNAERLEAFEAYVTRMINDCNISSDVFLKGSSFIMWWAEWKAYKKNQFPERSSGLDQIMETESWSEFGSIGRSTVGQEIISSSGEVKENISCTKESDLAQRKPREIELAEQRGTMFQVELYKMIGHEKGEGYYDSFKNQMDTNANLYRVTLGEFWDGIIASPSDFKSKNKWINAGTSYRKLVEPMDIAHYYRTSNRSGNYLQERPTRHRVLQQWLEDKEKSRSSRGQKPQKPRTKLPFLTGDSCFWAHVEEALKDLEQVEASKDLEQGLHQKKESLEKFEGYVTSIFNNISSDVFLEKSSFMTWWQRYNQIQSSGWKLSSPLYELMKRRVQVPSC